MTGGDCEGSSDVEARVPARDVACVGDSGSWLYQTAPLRRFDGTDAVGWGNERERQASCCSPRSSHRAVYREHLIDAGSYSPALHCIISVGPALFCSCPHWFLPNKALIPLTVHACQRWCAHGARTGIVTTVAQERASQRGRGQSQSRPLRCRAVRRADSALLCRRAVPANCSRVPPSLPLAGGTAAKCCRTGRHCIQPLASPPLTCQATASCSTSHARSRSMGTRRLHGGARARCNPPQPWHPPPACAQQVEVSCCVTR